MANVKFMTVKGSSSLSTSPFYVGLVQHERTMSKKESYDYLADRLGYKATAIRAVFLALKRFLRDNANKGNIAYIDGVASVRNTCKGAFATMSGPWVKGKNYLQVGAVELDPFKSTLKGIVPVNQTAGANPTINTVLDETTGLYDVIAKNDVISISGIDLGPDTTKTDEYVALADKTGTETKLVVSSSSLGVVKAKLETALTAGEYTLKVYTRSGLGTEFGVKCATRKVSVA